MENTRFYLDFSSEIQKLFYQNDITIDSILKGMDTSHEITLLKSPYYSEKEKTRDVVPVILASGAALTAITFCIKQILTTLYNKPYFIEYYENVEIKDAKGKVLVDKEGKPYFKQVKVSKLIQPREKNSKQNLNFKFNLKNGLVIKIGNKTQEK